MSRQREIKVSVRDRRFRSGKGEIRHSGMLFIKVVAMLSDCNDASSRNAEAVASQSVSGQPSRLSVVRFGNAPFGGYTSLTSGLRLRSRI